MGALLLTLFTASACMGALLLQLLLLTAAAARPCAPRASRECVLRSGAAVAAAAHSCCSTPMSTPLVWLAGSCITSCRFDSVAALASAYRFTCAVRTVRRQRIALLYGTQTRVLCL